jgi:hypothetical protein
MLFCKVIEFSNERNELIFFFVILFDRDVGVQAIEQLLEKRRNHFDYILLETTGVADPLPIVKMFWLDDELHSDLILDGRKYKKFYISKYFYYTFRFNNSNRCSSWIKSKNIR